MEVVATLRDNRTGLTMRYNDTVWQDGNGADPEGITWYWTEGNFSCDCNRSIVMYHSSESELDCNDGPNVIELLELVIDGKHFVHNGKVIYFN